MLIYFLPLLLLGILAIDETLISKKFSIEKFLSIGLLLLLFVGLRKEISCDWLNYIKIFEEAKTYPFIFIFNRDQPIESGFALIYWISSKIGMSFSAVNFILSGIFLAPLFLFCKELKRPFLSLLAAYPYFIVVIGMGFIRQAIAISIFMLAIQKLEKKKVLEFFLLVILASSFHKSAIIFCTLPFFIFYYKQINFRFNLRVMLLGVISLALSIVFVYPKFHWVIDTLAYYLFRYEYTPAQSIYIFIMNLIPAVIFLYYSKNITDNTSSKKIWGILSFLSIFSFIGGFVNTTLTYRFSLYFLPLQIFLASYVPDLKLFSLNEKRLVFIVISISLIQLIIWLNYANHNYCWIPYKNILFDL